LPEALRQPRAPFQRGYAERDNAIADNTPIRFALREMQRLARSPRVWVTLAALALILGLSGPFGTEGAMRLAPRIGYWGLIAVVTYFSGNLVVALLTQRFERTKPPLAIGFPAVTLSIALVVLAEVIVINWLVLGSAPRSAREVLSLGVNVLGVGIVVAGIIVYFSRSARSLKGQTAETATAQAPRILQRLDLHKRGTLISLSVQDHYTEIATNKGTALALLRLSDAIAEAEPTVGLQVHRSHWVATGEVASARRDGAKAVLTMSDGRDIPVSRTYVQAVKDAGLLPG
jgi:uncharacterized membrane protein